MESAITALSHKCLRRWRFSPGFYSRCQASSARAEPAVTRPWRRGTLLSMSPERIAAEGDLPAAPRNFARQTLWRAAIQGTITEPKPAKETTAYDREGPRRLPVAIGAARVRVVASGPVQSTSSASRALCARGGPRCTREAPRRTKLTRDAIAARHGCRNTHRSVKRRSRHR